jgi:hypothetical protein
MWEDVFHTTVDRGSGHWGWYLFYFEEVKLMSHIPFHPAIGFGDLLPGEFAVPQNPIRDAGTPLVPSTVAVMGGQPYRIPHLGELLAGKFTVPQNPIRAVLQNGYSGIPQSGMPKGCGCTSCSHGAGMGDLSSWLTATSVGSVPNWALVAVAAGALWVMNKPKHGRAN